VTESPLDAVTAKFARQARTRATFALLVLAAVVIGDLWLISLRLDRDTWKQDETDRWIAEFARLNPTARMPDMNYVRTGVRQTEGDR
jgi:hypothetical protein